MQVRTAVIMRGDTKTDEDTARLRARIAELEGEVAALRARVAARPDQDQDQDAEAPPPDPIGGIDAIEPDRRWEQVIEGIEAITEAFALFDAKDRLVFCNARYAATVPGLAGLLAPGLSFATIVRTVAESATFPGGEAEADAFVRDRLEQHRRSDGIHIERMIDGRWLRIREQRTRNDGVVILISDVTELRQREAALRQSEREFRDFAEAAADFYWETDTEHRLVRIASTNDPELQTHSRIYLGKRRQDSGMEATPESWALYQDALDRRRPFREFHCWRLDSRGRRRHLSISGKPIFDHTGQFHGFRGIGIDITRRIIAEQASKESAARLKQAQSMVRIASGTWDPETLCPLDGIADIAKLLDLPVIELTCAAGSFPRFVHPADRDAFLSVQRDILRSGHTYRREYRLLHPDGHIIHLNEVGWIERDMQGRPTRMPFTIQDISDHKAVEEDLRTAKTQAELASRAKSQFLAHMSHELRTPLNAILGFSDVMRLKMFGPLGNERYTAYAEHIHESGTHLLALINGVLDLAKIEAGKTRLDEETIDVAAMIDSCVNTIRLRAESEDIALNITVPPDIGLRGDALRVKQVVLNLLSNAVKFTARGGRIEVSAARAREGGLEILVADTGKGIPPEQIERALSPFEQIAAPYSRSHEGTGLGLPLAKAFVELHDGRLSVISKVGLGTTVIAAFPAYRVLTLYRAKTNDR